VTMQLSPDFTLEEMPCYQRATGSDIDALKTTVARVLQPARDKWGPLVVTSWKWWANGCSLRTGAHGQTGGTVDFITPRANLVDVFKWGLLMPWRDYVGRWIYEPAVLDSSGGVLQGEHIHVATIRDMVSAFGPAEADSAAYVLTGVDSAGEDTYTPVPGWGGPATSTLQVEGTTLSMAGANVAPWAVGAVALVFGLAIAHHNARG